MTEDRFLLGFQRFDVSVEPDEAFAERLFEDLATQLGFRATPAVSEPWLIRIRRALGIERWPAGATALRLAYVAAIVGLLVALLAGLAFVASQLREETKTPEELVSLSQAVYEDPPAFTMTFRTPTGGTQVLASDGTGTWRIESDEEAPGSYWLYDGERVGHYSADMRTWGVHPAGESGPPGPLGSEFAWAKVDYEVEGYPVTVIPCAGPTSLGEDQVIGRPADRVICGDIGMTFWIDRETRLVLRIEAGPDTPNWDISGEGIEPGIRALDLTVGAVEASRFDWAGPPGAYPEDQPPPSNVLEVGADPPGWSGRTLDGETLSTSDMGHPAAVLFWLPGAGDATLAHLSSALAERPGIAGVVVAGGLEGTVVGYLRLNPTSLPVVLDSADEALAAWGVLAWPSLVLLDADGRVASILTGSLERADVDRLLDALSAGVAPPVIPSPSPEPPPSLPPLPDGSSGDTATLWPIGTTIAAWSGPLADGSPFGSADLAGRPAVIWFASPPCEGCPTEDWDRYAEAALALGDRATFVIIAAGEPTPGWVVDRLAPSGAPVTVVYDWSGTLEWEPFLANMPGTVVLDGDGRLAGQVVRGDYGAAGAEDLEPILDGLEAPAPSP